MRLATEANKLNTGGVEAQGSFKIKASGKAFRILIDGLYSDKILSIVRELASNAFDSHTMLGSKENFYVHCPTLLKPEFFVRDYGVGMSDSKVMDLYSTVFGSDKDESNDLVGAFGLGSKSPFAYTDQFCVSCYDGVNVRHYAAAIGEGGVPQIIHAGTEPCDEPLGVRVSFNVQNTDFAEFEKAINKVSLGFDPVFETNLTIKSKKGKPGIKGTGWQAFEASGSDLPSQYNVRQGCVIYPLEATGGLNLPYDGSRKYLFEAPIGTVEVTSSRESVAYSAPVIAYLKQRLIDFVDEYPKLIHKKVGKIDNVADFFDKVQAIRPGFLSDKFIHLETGLKEARVQITKPACIMDVQYGDRAQRWDYSFQRSLDCRASKAEPKTVFEIADIGPMLDIAREEKDGFSTREHRRISRLLRNYLEVNNSEEATFWLGLDWTDRFVELTQPHVERIKITCEDLMSAVPSRRGRPVEAIIRGVAVLRGDGTEARPISAIEPTEGEAAWVTADAFRKEPKALRVIARKFGVNEFYVASSAAYKTMEDSSVPKLQAFIDAKLKAEHGVSWNDWTEAHKIGKSGSRSYSYHSDYLLKFVTKVLDADPKLFERMKRAHGFVGDFTKAFAPYIKGKLLPIDDHQTQEAVKALANDVNVPMTPEIKTISKIYSLISDNEASPAIRFFSNINNASTPKQIAMAVDGIIAIFKAMPLNHKVKWKDY
jgi:Molecular chaperone, HSP90 family